MIRALLVGINEYKTKPLRGALNDVERMRAYLKSRGVADGAVAVLPEAQATKVKIEQSLVALLNSGEPGDHLLFYFSGHGSQQPSADPDESDGLDEVLCPIDWRDDPETSLSDNRIAEIVASLRPGASLTLVFDACHSGDGAAIGPEQGTRFQPTSSRPPRRQKRARWSKVRATLSEGSMLVAACADSETAVEARFEFVPFGVFTWHFTNILSQEEGLTVRDAVKQTGVEVKQHDMHPQIDPPSTALADKPFLASA
ncbi:MAG: caspase family protein [Myxococcales bacterium]|nr:caspase family protein [Myxococcales bacterium]